MIEHYKNLSLEDIDGEIWKDIPGYEGLYQASNLGRLKSLPKKRDNGFRECKILKQSRDTVGYPLAFLYKDGVRKTYKTHRIVMLAFVGDSRLKVDHFDEVKTNNTLSNLEYVTQRENTHRYYSNKRDLPVGVKRRGKQFYSSIVVNKKAYRLGTRDTVDEALELFNRGLNDLENIDKYAIKFIPNKIKSWATPYKEIFFKAMVRKNSKNKCLGVFSEESTARRIAFRYELTFQNLEIW